MRETEKSDWNTLPSRIVKSIGSDDDYGRGREKREKKQERSWIAICSLLIMER